MEKVGVPEGKFLVIAVLSVEFLVVQALTAMKNTTASRADRD